MQTLNPLPWYRVPFVWLVFAIPLTAVVTGIVLITISIKYNDGLVVDDYYKQGLGINQRLQRQKNAETMGLTGEIRLDRSTGAVTVTLNSREQMTTDGSLEFGLYHTTHDNEDQNIQLLRVSPGVFTGKLEPVSDGRWHMVLEQPQWRLDGGMDTRGDDQTPVTGSLMPRL